MALMPKRFKAKSSIAGVREAYTTAKLVDQRRGSAHRRGYTAQWGKARLMYLTKHPLCVCCLANGRTAASSVVDHVIPHRGDTELFWDSGNWQALCKACHDVIKATVEHRWTAGTATNDDLNLARLIPEFHPN